MSDDFFNAAAPVRQQIREQMDDLIGAIPDPKIKQLVRQRVKSSHFIKGCIAYFLLEGLNAPVNKLDKIRFCAGLEMYATAPMLLDNLVDHHTKRNGETTYLKEYGPEWHALASHYASYLGLRILLPYLTRYTQMQGDHFKLDESLLGMSRMDLQQSESLQDQIEVITLTNGYYLQTFCAMAASLANSGADTMARLDRFALHAGTGFGIYEEVRDLLGGHGRRRATEVESGRVIIPLHYARQKDETFKPTSYVGKRLDDAQYRKLIRRLNDTGALDASAELMHHQFATAQDNIQQAVDDTTAVILSQHCLNAEHELEDLIQTAKRL